MTQARALIVDDEPDIRDLVSMTLSKMDLQTDTAGDLKTARRLLDTRTPDICLVDMQLPDGNGIDLIRRIKDSHPKMPVAMITAHGTMDTAVEAMKAGAFDFISKPISLEGLRTLVRNALSLSETTPTEEKPPHRLIGNSRVMQDVRNLIDKIAQSQAPVFISGETGTGKELAARSIHERGPRAAGPFIAVNCGAIPSELMESEFFGHIKGSFTGAHRDKTGFFQEAHTGTLFLDEIAELPLNMQVKLLRVIQEKRVRPVGSHQEQPIDVRIISATHKNIASQVDSGAFRQDLYYRVKVLDLQMPSLRAHKEDIGLLADRFLSRATGSGGSKITPEAKGILSDYPFPGNVRELENILERASSLCEKGIIEPIDIQLPQTQSPQGDGEHHSDLETHLDIIEQERVLQALHDSHWNRTTAAEALGISSRQLRYKIEKFQLNQS